MNQFESETVSLTAVPLPLTAEDRARADLYALIARLLLAPPDAALLANLSEADSLASQQTDNPLDRAWEKLILAAGIIDEHAIRDEFDALFVSTGNPQVDPYASLYLAGFMMEKPLSALRSDLLQLGLMRIPGVCELEDHLAALCETMRLLITGEQGGTQQPIQRQKVFFEKHIAPWYGRCMHDIRSAEGANFYRLIADFAQAFLDIESQAFEMEYSRHGKQGPEL
jgi:TorA maturation chaperone TorD